MRNQILSIFVMLLGVLMHSSCTSELSSNENVKDDGAEFWPNVVLMPVGFQRSDLVFNLSGVTQTCSGPIPPTSIMTRILSLCQRIRHTYCQVAPAYPQGKT